MSGTAPMRYSGYGEPLRTDPQRMIHEPPVVGDRVKSPITQAEYEIGPPLGEGHFAYVHECTDVYRNRLVAKVLKQSERPAAEVSRAWERERVTMDQVRHPLIVHIYESFVTRGAYYIIAERCEMTLRQALEDPALRTQIDPMRVARHLLQATQAVHRKNRFHFDIHLENVMLKRSLEGWDFKLADFGLSQIGGDLDLTPLFANAFRPPEATDRRAYGPLDHRVDVYHCALVLLQVVVGRPLIFSPDEVMAAAPRKQAAGLPAPWSLALQRALRRHAAVRTASAEELWRDLQMAR